MRCKISQRRYLHQCGPSLRLALRLVSQSVLSVAPIVFIESLSLSTAGWTVRQRIDRSGSGARSWYAHRDWLLLCRITEHGGCLCSHWYRLCGKYLTIIVIIDIITIVIIRSLPVYLWPCLAPFLHSTSLYKLLGFPKFRRSLSIAVASLHLPSERPDDRAYAASDDLQSCRSWWRSGGPDVLDVCEIFWSRCWKT